jgi:hypothetical protein
MSMSPLIPPRFRPLAATLLAASLLLAGCDSFNNAWYKASHTDDTSELGEASMDRHYLNGDISEQQFHEQVKVFNPNAQIPVKTGGPQPASTTAPTVSP